MNPKHKHVPHHKSIAITLISIIPSKFTLPFKKKKRTHNSFLGDIMTPTTDNAVPTKVQIFVPFPETTVWTNTKYKNLIKDYAYDTDIMMNKSKLNFYILQNMTQKFKYLILPIPIRRLVDPRSDNNNPRKITSLLILYSPSTIED